MRTILGSITAGLLLVAAIWAMSFAALEPADFTFSNGSEIKTVDPALVTGQPEGRIVRALFEGLCAWDPKTLDPIPGVAEAWGPSDDKLTWTFHLRDDARWSDGSPVVAADFHWSYRRFLHPETGSEYAYQLWYVVGAEQYTSGKVEVGDPVEVELTGDPPEDRPFARGPIHRGKLVAIDEPDREGGTDGEATPSATKAVYTVEIGGRTRRFQQGARAPGTEDYRWLLLDFDTVGIQTPDRRTVVFHLKHAVPYFPNLLGFYPMFPVNPRCYETYGYPGWTKPRRIVTNGPYLLEFRRIRDRIRLVKNPHYWDRENVKLDVIDALAVESYTTMLNLYLTGQVDWIPVVPAEVIPDLLKRPAKDFVPSAYLSTYYYLVNVSKPPLDDPRVRRALGMAMGKREIVEKITRAGQQPTRSIVPPNISNYVDYKSAECDARDLEKARRLLAEAGYPQGRGFPKLEILYNTADTHQAIAELIQSQWKRELGIDVGLVNQEWPSYLNSRRLGQYHIARAGWIGDYVDPNTFLELFLTENPNNHTRWGNAEYDRLVTTAQSEPDGAKRMRMFHDAEQILMDEMPIIPIYSYVDQNMVRPYVKGFYRNILDTHPLKDISIDSEEKARILKAEGLR